MEDRMRRFVVLFAAALVLARPAGAGEVLYQHSTLSALMGGAYDGDLPVAELLRHGDTGLGTYQGLDGEMVVVDGKAYQVKFSGGAAVADARATTPFAQVVPFRPDGKVAIPAGLDLRGLERALDGSLANISRIQVVRMDGRFAGLRARSVAAQAAPYRVLTAIIPKEQAIFDMGEVEGSLIGFRFPPTAAGVNVPGWHFHFLTRDRTRGGHVLDLTTAAGEAALQEVAEWRVTLPAGIGATSSGTPYDPKSQKN
jgi:acetolactate decarboxylase